MFKEKKESLSMWEHDELEGRGRKMRLERQTEATVCRNLKSGG